MADHEMMNLDEMGRLRDSMELLGEELMNWPSDQPESLCRIRCKKRTA